MKRRNDKNTIGDFFPKNAYEIIFSVFMVAIAYLSRYSEQVVYPRILYFFLFLMLSHLIFSCVVTRYCGIKAKYTNILIILNIGLITGILMNSGASGSYFWVLYMLPLFTSAFIVNFWNIVFVLLLISGILGYFYSLINLDAVNLACYFTKVSFLIISSAVVYRISKFNKKLSVEIDFKRKQVDVLNEEMTKKNSEIIHVGSMVEVGEIVSGLAHDLRNIMTIISLSSEIVYQSDTHSKKDIETIMKAAKLAKGMLGNVMQIVKSENYKFEIADIKEPVKRAVEILNSQAEKKRINISLYFAENLPRLKISKIHIERVIINVLLNSISLMENGGTIKIRVYLDNGYIVVKVEDEGPGFSEDVLKKGIKVFNTSRKDKGGAGLGLFVCDQIIRKHGGSISISNGREKGSVLEFKFPI
ncbi:MAG: HAMP domain-containing histidine kinase [Elusimicrobia bacterium]|nr:HAMP domain-containing histidine kinase [Elusimicrobiota bacterium]